jgi:hypothetical protein
MVYPRPPAARRTSHAGRPVSHRFLGCPLLHFAAKLRYATEGSFDAYSSRTVSWPPMALSSARENSPDFLHRANTSPKAIEELPEAMYRLTMTSNHTRTSAYLVQHNSSYRLRPLAPTPPHCANFQCRSDPRKDGRLGFDLASESQRFLELTRDANDC